MRQMDLAEQAAKARRARNDREWRRSQQAHAQRLAAAIFFHQLLGAFAPVSPAGGGLTRSFSSETGMGFSRDFSPTSPRRGDDAGLSEQSRLQAQQRVRGARWQKKGGKKRREQVCPTPPARTANPSLRTYILARGTLAAAMTPIRALASSTTPLSIHLSPALHDQP